MTTGQQIEVFVEAGAKRALAGALAWPGWCREGRDEAAALQALHNYAPRYAAVAALAGLAFTPPAGISGYSVSERPPGTSATDFGVPGAILAYDAGNVDDAELQRLGDLLRGCWRAFNGAAAKAAAAEAAGKELRKGPRGGGRDLAGITEHVIGANGGYLGSLGRKLDVGEAGDPKAQMARTLDAVLAALAASAHGEIEPRGPRGGLRWPARYFARRVAWHVLDHAWEIEDRLV